MTDWYNTFLLSVYLDVNPADVEVLITDAHPKGIVQHSNLSGTLFTSKCPLKILSLGDNYPHPNVLHYRDVINWSGAHVASVFHWSTSDF